MTKFEIFHETSSLSKKIIFHDGKETPYDHNIMGYISWWPTGITYHDGLKISPPASVLFLLLSDECLSQRYSYAVNTISSAWTVDFYHLLLLSAVLPIVYDEFLSLTTYQDWKTIMSTFGYQDYFPTDQNRPFDAVLMGCERDGINNASFCNSSSHWLADTCNATASAAEG